MKKLVLFLLLVSLLCSPGLVGFAAEASYEEYMSKERSLSDISPTDYSKQWVGDPFVMRDGLLSGYQKKYPDASLVVGNAYQERIVDGKTQLVCVAEGNFGSYNSSGRYTYLSTGGTILQLDLTTLKSVAIYTGNDSIDQLWVFEDIIYFSSAGSIYRYYAPDGSSELLYTTDTALKGIRPLSNYIIMLVEDNPDYWEAVAASGVKEGELLKDREAFSKWMNEKFGLQTSPESKPFLYCDVQNILMVCGISSAKSSWYNTKTKELYTSSKEAKAVAPIAFAETSDESLFEDLMLQIPDSVYTGKKESILTISGSGLGETGQTLLSIFFYGLRRDGLLSGNTKYFEKPPTKEQLAGCPKVSAEDVEKTLTRLFGPDAMIRFGGLQDSYMSNGYLVLDRLEDGSYAYYQYSYGGGEGFYTRDFFLRSETVGEDVIVYSSFLYAPPVADLIFWVNGGASSDMVLLDLDQQEKKALPGGVNPWVMINKGVFDEYLPVYKHTFKPNGDGTYYWAQTELDTAGKEIPLSVFEEEAKYLQSLVATVPEEAYRGSVTNPNYQSHSKLTYSRLYGDGYDTLFVNEAYAEWTVEGASLILYSPRGNEKTGGRITLGTWDNVSPDKNQASIEGLIRDEKFVQYYTVYRHTFQKKADGTYSWVETSVDQYGEEMPSALTGGSSNKNTDSTTNTTTDTVSDVSDSDVVTDTVTDTSDTVLEASTDTVTEGTGSEIVTDVSTGTATDVVPQEEGSSAVWIVVAVIAVAAVAAVAVFFVLKKKKA